jgi:hypothetical protein
MEDITKKATKAKVSPREIATLVISSNNTREDLKVPINLEQVYREQELLLVIPTAATVDSTTKVDGLEDSKLLY